MNLPRLFINGKFARIVNPISVSITQNLVPLSTATITLPEGEELPERAYLELFTPYGSAGMYRVRSPHDVYGRGGQTSAELEHMISEVNDYLVKEEISEMVAASTAMQRVFKHYGGTRWKLGKVSALGTDKIALEAKYDGVLEVMLSILAQKPDCMMYFDFSTSPWTVSVVKKDSEVSAEGRLSRNVSTASVSSDDTELCTRVWYQTFDEKKNATWKHKDASTKSKYGIVEKTLRTSSDMDDDEIDILVNAYISEHKNPRYTINIQGLELAQITSEKLDKILVGKLYRLTIPEKEVVVTDHVTSIVWNDIYNNPMSMNVNVGAEEDTVITFLHNLDAKGGGGGGGGKAKDQQEKEWSKYIVEWDKNKDNIAGMVAVQTEQGKILKQAGMTIDENGVLQYAKNKKTNIMAHLDAERKRIDLVVKGTGKDAKVNAASIMLGINRDNTSTIKLSATKVDLGKYATVETLNTKIANVEKFFSGDATAKKLVAGTFSCLNFTFNGGHCYWRFFDLDGTRHWYIGL